MKHDPEFVRLSPTSRVHIIERGRPPRIAHWLNGEATAAWVLMFGYVGTTYCGHNATHARGSYRVSIFPDDALCTSCYRIYPGAKEELFRRPMVLP